MDLAEYCIHPQDSTYQANNVIGYLHGDRTGIPSPLGLSWIL